MSENNTYLRMSTSDMQIANLLSQINDILANERLSGISLSGELSFAPDGTPSTGMIRFNGTNMQYSVDGGTTWQTFSSLDIAWSQSVLYNTNDVVLYNGAWWKCTGTNVSDIPGNTDKWQLLSLGSEIIFVHTYEQLHTALASTTDCTIYISGTITIPSTAELVAVDGTMAALFTVVTRNITIYSDARAKIISPYPLEIRMTSNSNVYWYCKNTEISPVSAGATLIVNARNGILWLDSFKSSGKLQFNNQIKYQATWNEEATSGGQVSYWTLPDLDQFVPKKLNKTGRLQSPNDNTYIYGFIPAENNVPESSGYIELGSIKEDIAARTAKYWKINSQGELANLPGSAPTGYLYYATDTGDIYRYNGSGWDDPVHIQGPQGEPGAPGSNGAAGVSPNVTMLAVSGGTQITITDEDNPGGISFIVSDGEDGESPSLTVGNVDTLPPESAAFVTIVGSSPNYTLNFGIPRGWNGGATWGGIAGNIGDQLDLQTALNAKQPLITSDDMLPYSLVSGTPTIGSGLLTISSGGIEVAVFGANSEYDVALQLPVVNNATITFTQGGTPKGSITLNQSGDQTIALDAGGGGTQVQADWNQTDSDAVDYIKNKPIIPDVGSGTIIFTQGGVSKGEFNVNQSENQTIVLDAGGSGGSASPYTELIETSSAVLSAVVGNAYKWTLNNSSGTIAMAGTSSGYESFASLYIVLGGSATVTGNNVTLIDPLSAECLNLCGLQYDGDVARLYVYNVIPIITVTSSPIAISGIAGTALSSVDLKTYVTVGKSSVLNFVVDSNSVLPTGLALSNDGVLTGTPTTGNNGSAVVNITTSKAEPKTIQLNFTISGQE